MVVALGAGMQGKPEAEAIFGWTFGSEWGGGDGGKDVRGVGKGGGVMGRDRGVRRRSVIAVRGDG